MGNNHEQEAPELDSLFAAAETFATRCRQELAAWHAWLQESAPGTVALWGSGSKATGFLTTLTAWAIMFVATNVGWMLFRAPNLAWLGKAIWGGGLGLGGDSLIVAVSVLSMLRRAVWV